MASYYKHIYAALRSAMIDRDMGDKEEEAVLIDFKSAQVALKPELPSAALLISYSMLYYPNWLNTADPSKGLVPVGRPIEDFIGGTENYKFPLTYNIHLAMIAVAVGCYAKLWTVQYSHILGTIMINPNMESPLVQKTLEMLTHNKDLNYTHARDIFVELMQQEEYAQGIILADDYVANAKFIAEAEATVETTAEEMKEQVSKSVDLSDYFKGETH